MFMAVGISFAVLFALEDGHILRGRQELSGFGQSLLHTLLTGVVTDEIRLSSGLQILGHGAVAEGGVLQEVIRAYQQHGVGGIVL